VSKEVVVSAEQCTWSLNLIVEVLCTYIYIYSGFFSFYYMMLWGYLLMGFYAVLETIGFPCDVPSSRIFLMFVAN
jgi:hypothetical protein